MTRMRVALLLIPVLLSLAAHRTAAQGSPCDASLKPQDGPDAYKRRDDRCEGLYVRNVAGTIMYIASLTARFENFDPAAHPNLHLSWPSPPAAPLRIQVIGIQPDFYFRMDTERPANAKGYDWPTSVLSSLKVHRNDLGALAWTRRPGSRPLRVYVPLSITSSKGSTPRTSYTLVVYPVRDLKEIYLTLGPADSATGQPLPGQLLKQQEPQQQGYYPGERPVRMLLPELEPGLYYLQVTATLQDGTPAGAESMLIDTSVPGGAAP